MPDTRLPDLLTGIWERAVGFWELTRAGTNRQSSSRKRFADQPRRPVRSLLDDCGAANALQLRAAARMRAGARARRASPGLRAAGRQLSVRLRPVSCVHARR